MRTQHYRFKRRFFVILGVFIVCTIAFIALMVSCTDTGEKEKEKAKEVPVYKASLVAFGDDLFHDTVYQAYESDGYDFSPIFENVKKDIDKADIAIAELVVDVVHAILAVGFFTHGLPPLGERLFPDRKWRGWRRARPGLPQKRLDGAVLPGLRESAYRERRSRSRLVPFG